ncbi:MAG: LysM peptidoglycan-binding domain-containing protein [Treponema sp.]|jgi:hypothetical protein|nr:LysM peptidoglycan-binding domain-containing protein [Treponema sp.]
MMKKVLLVLVLLLAAVLVLSCKSKPDPLEDQPPSEGTAGSSADDQYFPPPTDDQSYPSYEEEEPDYSFFESSPSVEPVYERYSGGIILEGAQTHLVVWGDTLTKLAVRYYGSQNSYFFPLILLGSRNVISDPDVIIPGTRLTIPDLQRNLNDPTARQRLKDFLYETSNTYEGGSRRNWEIEVRNGLRSLASSL